MRRAAVSPVADQRAAAVTIYARSGSHYYRFWFRGRLFERGGYPTQRAAMEAEWERRREVGAVGPRHRAPVLRMADAIERYLAAVVPQHRNARHERYALGLVAERLGPLPLSTVRPEDLDAYRRWRLEHRGTRYRADCSAARRPVSPSTINRDLAYVSALYNWCARQGWVEDGRNPVRGLRRYREPWRPWIVLSPKQEATLWRLLPERERIRAQLLRHLGVRKGVVLGLRWEAVDWGHRVIHWTSKGKSGVVPMNRVVSGLLRRLGPQTAGPIFPVKTDTTLRRWWVRARTQLGLPTLRLHDLRVAYARSLASRGVDTRTIMALLGHSTPTMTLRYIPPDLAVQRRAVALLEQTVGKTVGNVRK